MEAMVDTSHETEKSRLGLGQQIGNRVGVGVAGVVQAGKSETAFARPEQRKVSVEL